LTRRSTSCPPARPRHDRCETSRWSRPAVLSPNASAARQGTIDARPRGGLDKNERRAAPRRGRGTINARPRGGLDGRYDVVVSTTVRPRAPRRTCTARSMRDLVVVSTSLRFRVFGHALSTGTIDCETSRWSRPPEVDRPSAIARRHDRCETSRWSRPPRSTVNDTERAPACGTIDARPRGGLDPPGPRLPRLARLGARSMRDLAVVSTGSVCRRAWRATRRHDRCETSRWSRQAALSATRLGLQEGTIDDRCETSRRSRQGRRALDDRGRLGRHDR